MAIEVLLYAITALIVINGIAVLTAIWVAIQGGRVEECRRQYWQAILKKAQREVSKDEQAKSNP